MDGFEGKTERTRYDYPFAEPPQPGTVMEVAPGVKWVRMPLPFSLKWINLWLLEPLGLLLNFAHHREVQPKLLRR